MRNPFRRREPKKPETPAPQAPPSAPAKQPPAAAQPPRNDQNRSRRGKPHNQQRGGRPPERGGSPQHHGRSSGAPASTAPTAGGKIVEGALQRKGKVGFVLSEEAGQTDVLIQGASLRLAMDGDRVRVKLQASPAGGRRIGEIIEVISRSRQTFLGLFRREAGESRLQSEEDETFVRLTDLQGLNPHEGDIAVARVVQWPVPGKPASGVLVEVIGPRDAQGADLRILIRKYELPDGFPADAEAEAAVFGSEVPESAWAGRENLFDKRVFTIDGSDAKDFDDAVSLEPGRDGGWKLGVHIADVSHYVKPGGAIDKEAYRRGTSVYLSGNVLPMLPFALADNLCSLRPDVPRLTLSCEMEIAPDGNVVGHRVFESVIRSCRRFTYEEVAAIVKGETIEGLDPLVAKDVRMMEDVAQLVRKLRFGRGSLDFDFPEPYIITDVTGRPIDIKKRARLSSHRLIEDFMILANETVAVHMRSLPFLYRIHEKPDLVKLERLQRTLEALGVPVPAGMSEGKPQVMQKLLKSTEGKPVQSIVHTMVLRSLKQAVYSEVNAGHFGLGSTCYTHFTSPIRRYPDLTVHRLLREQVRGQLSVERQGQWTRELPTVCRECSVRERAAVVAEREFMDIQRVRFMEKRVGEEFEAVVTSVTAFGIFVQPKEAFVEGLVRLSDLDDYFVFDEARLMLVGKRSGKKFHIGTPVKVKLAGANPLSRQLDFQLIEDGAPRRPQGGGGGGRSDRDRNRSRHRRR